jgi:hypothetical protein
MTPGSVPAVSLAPETDELTWIVLCDLICTGWLGYGARRMEGRLSLPDPACHVRTAFRLLEAS